MKPTIHQVRVTGNNRTKTSLIGLEGVVKKAVGLGGWHWLRLSTGAECRLQRNALAVVAHPTGLELESSEDEEEDEEEDAARRKRAKSSSGSGGAAGPDGAGVPHPGYAAAQIPPGPRGKRASRPPANRFAPDADAVQGGIGSRRLDRRRRAGEKTSVDFSKLERETLMKINRHHYKADPKPEEDANKRGLVTAIADHFSKERVDETKVLVAFIKALAGGEIPSEGRPAE